MMATLVIRLAGPLQSWGSDSKFEIRKTHKEPTKSGIVGLLAAALGRKRYENVDDLCQLRIGIRVDREGDLLRDFHMVAPKKKGKKASVVPYMMVPALEDDRGKAWITNRYYLSDAVFIVGIESDNEEFIYKLEQALRSPKYPLYLGRRSCPPEFPVVLGVKGLPLVDTLKAEPWAVSEWDVSRWEKNGKPAPELRLIIDTEPEDLDAYLQNDAPISFNPNRRLYGIRAVKEMGFVSPNNTNCSNYTEHDAMEELR